MPVLRLSVRGQRRTVLLRFVSSGFTTCSFSGVGAEMSGRLQTGFATEWSSIELIMVDGVQDHVSTSSIFFGKVVSLHQNSSSLSVVSVVNTFFFSMFDTVTWFSLFIDRLPG